MLDSVCFALRVVNVVLGLLCLFLCTTKASHYWPRFSNTARGFVASLILFSFAAVWGTGEQIAQHVSPGSRVIVTSVALLNLLYALWSTRGRSFFIQFRDEHRPGT